MKNKKLTLTIGIPAHNEAKNISKLILSIFSQNQKYFVLQKVIVMCDGCTDNTAEIVRKLSKQFNKLIVVNDGKRKGKSARINELYKRSNSYLLACIDADVLLEKESLNNLVREFLLSDVSLVGGCDLPTKGTTFSEQVSVSWITHWQSLIRSVNNYDNSTNCPGRIYALKKSFYKSFTLPTKVVADDLFVFYMGKKRKVNFKFAPKAIAYFRAPLTFHDFIEQSIRFGKSGDDVKKYFGKLSKSYSQVGTKAKVQKYSLSLLKDPIHFSFALLMQLYVRWKYDLAKKTYTDGHWESVKK